MAKFGNKVTGLDVDTGKIAKLSQGKVPFYEPSLEDLVVEGIANKNLSFTTSYEEAIPGSDVIMIAVGTPSAPNGTADLTYVKAAAESLAPYLSDKAIIAIKSTVPPGTNDVIEEIIKAKTAKPFYLASLPEFLREGSAVQDTLKPDRVLIGADEPFVIDKLIELHSPLNGERIIISPESAQMAKYAANAYLAQRITFINQIADLCEKNGADISEVIDAIGFDRRIGRHYWYPGLGYGGSCFPKDVKELAAYARQAGETDHLLIRIDELNENRIPKKLRQFEEEVGGFGNKKVAVLGLSFKPNTNDIRYAPSLTVIPILKEAGATISAYDPQAIEEAKKVFDLVTFTKNPYEAAKGADIIMLLIEWEELRKLNMKKLAAVAAPGAWFIDTRNQYDPESVREVGLRYTGIGTP